MKTTLLTISNSRKMKFIYFLLGIALSLQLQAQSGFPCIQPWIPPGFDVAEIHSDIPQSFWQNGGHIPENVVDEDTTNYARAHIKATGSATLKVYDINDSIYSSGIFVGFCLKSRAFRDTIFAGVTITAYLNGVMTESYDGVHLMVDTIPTDVNQKICMGFVTTQPWNQLEITLDTAGGRVHYDVFYAILEGPCLGELPPPLPITWLSFEALKKGEASDLKWITAQEFNNTGFQVERSADGRYFETIGSVDAASDPQATNVYSFMDTRPYRGMNYYRIKQTDIDGRIDYSIIRTVGFGTVNEIRLWPNPAVESMHIEIPDEIADQGEIKLINSSGVVILSQTYDNNDRERSVNLGNIEPGIYSVVIESLGTRYMSKVVVIK
jgi:hypothetical protein